MNFSATAQDKELAVRQAKTKLAAAGGEQSYDFSRYLSASDMLDISDELATSDIVRKYRDGTLFDYIDAPSQPISFSFNVAFKRVETTLDRSENDSWAVNAASSGAGTIGCTNIQAHNPHAGSGPGGTTVPKAKASGKCTYVHGTGTPPPSVTWNLTQTLKELDLATGLFTGQWNAIHPKSGYVVEWFQNPGNPAGQNGTQVFGDCPPTERLFSHDVRVFVQAPSGWTYTGPNPFSATPSYSLFEC
jgi:hypothetical protein